jgi:hypothetical protein
MRPFQRQGGSTLKTLMEETGAKFWIPAESPAGSNQRAITITGDFFLFFFCR